MPKTFDLPCLGYSVKADLYEADQPRAVLLSLIGRTSYRTKRQYVTGLPKLAAELNITSLIFDYTGHGDSPFSIEDIYPAQNFLEVITAFDWLRAAYPGLPVIVAGSSYGGFMATQLTKYRPFNYLILRAPAMYPPSNFYTKGRDEDKAAIAAFRHDEAALAEHPLLTGAASFHGETLLIVHENDEVIPSQTTDAYADAFKPELIVAQGYAHSLDVANDEQVTAYTQLWIDWLSKQLN